jgi:hypothetical protein
LLFVPSAALFVVTCHPSIVDAATVNNDNRMVATASSAAAQLAMTTTITVAAFGQRCHCRQCHLVIIVINGSGNNAIAANTINC